MKKFVWGILVAYNFTNVECSKNDALNQSKNFFSCAIATDVSRSIPYDMGSIEIDFSPTSRKSISNIKVNGYRRKSEIVTNAYFKTNDAFHQFKARSVANVYNN